MPAAEELRQAQMELAYANRVTIMGQMAASIVHEVNQPIKAGVTNAHAALRWPWRQSPDLGEVQQVLQNFIKVSNRASDVIGQIRGLFKKAPPRKDGLEINEVIHEVVAFHGEAVKSSVVVRNRPSLKACRSFREIESN